MITGNGLFANKFIKYIDDPSTMIFASGVSNSQEADVKKYRQEIDLLKKTIEASDKDIFFVYFSSCSIYDHSKKNSKYVKHKLKIEKIIQKNINNFLIFRIPQTVAHSTNQHTLTNFFANSIMSSNHFQVWKHAHRNLVDIDDIYKIINFILKHHTFKNRVINIAYPKNTSVEQIVKILEKTLNKEADYSLIEKGSTYSIPVDDIIPIIKALHISFSQNYNTKIIRKYYPWS